MTFLAATQKLLGFLTFSTQSQKYNFMTDGGLILYVNSSLLIDLTRLILENKGMRAVKPKKVNKVQ